MIKLYELAKRQGDPEGEIDRYEVGRLVGEHTKGADNTVQILTKNNFIKRGDEGKIYLTSLGLGLAKELQKE